MWYFISFVCGFAACFMIFGDKIINCYSLLETCKEQRKLIDGLLADFQAYNIQFRASRKLLNDRS